MNGGAGGLEIGAGIEALGVLVKVLADGGSHCKAQVGIDVDLADGHGSGLAQHLFGDADGVGHLAAVLVDDADELLRHGGSAVQHDGEAGQTLRDLLENVEAELGLRAGLELVRAVARADGDGETVAAGAGHEFLDILGTGVGAVLGLDVDVVLHARERAELGLNDDTVVVRVFDDLAGESDVVLEGLAAAVDHDGGEAAVDAALAELKAVTVVQMQGDRKTGLQLGGLDELDKIGVVGVGTRAAGDLQDDGSLDLGRGLGDALDDLHVVDVERADGIAALIRLAEHFLCGYDRHDIYLRYIKYMDTLFCTSALYQCFRAASTAEILFFLPFAEKKLARL